MDNLKWSLDSLVVKDNTLFGFGWVFHPTSDIDFVGIRYGGTDGSCGSGGVIRADSGKPREDVAHAFPDNRTSLNSGFVVFGEIPAANLHQQIFVEVILTDGKTISCAVPSSSIIHFSAEGVGKARMISQYIAFFKRGLHLARSRQFSALFTKIRRYLKGRPKTLLTGASELEQILRPEGKSEIVLIVDHDLGGGANHYREKMVDSLIAGGAAVLILTFHVATLSHVLIVRGRKVRARVAIPSKSFMLQALARVPVREIIYNTGVSFTRPEELPPLLSSIKKLKNARLKILVHDFFSVCPSHFLLDHKGVYCRLPDPVTCSNCLTKNQQGFATLFAQRSIHTWRLVWGSLLTEADEIVVFSNSSREIICRAYPELRSEKIAIVPHTGESTIGKIPVITKVRNLHIGVVGQIGLHKGAAIIQALGREIRSRGLPVRISVIGALEASCDSSIITQSGAYRREDLPQLIEESGMNIVLFPSICPETFSYVVQELMQLSLPVASFDFGAPAERLAKYSKGLILQSQEPASILDELTAFHQKIYFA